MSDAPTHTVSIEEHSRFAQRISDTIAESITSGLPPDVALCIAVQVAADYGRGHFGERCLPILADLIRERAGTPMPPTADSQPRGLPN